jgi:putative Holliday junction resolvase
LRVIALDLGARRIGVAVSDRSGVLASPLTVLERTGSQQRDHHRIASLVQEEDAQRVIVGLPLSLDGAVGAAAEAAIAEATALASVLAVPVETFDERFTTTTAHAHLMERNMKAPARRRVVDKVAAAVMLQTWLDGGRGRDQDAST